MADVTIHGTIKTIDNDNALITIEASAATPAGRNRTVDVEISTKGFSAEQINNQVKVGDFIRVNGYWSLLEGRHLIVIPGYRPIEHVLFPVPTR